MSIKSQQKNMKEIYNLVSQDLGYIFGEHERGPNGAKRKFHTKSASFLRMLGGDLGFKAFKVTNNPAGIAVSGEITMMGMWEEGNGLYLQLSQSTIGGFLYRNIKSMKDYNGGRNEWLSYDIFATGDYEIVVKNLLKLKKSTLEVHHAA